MIDKGYILAMGKVCWMISDIISVTNFQSVSGMISDVISVH